MNEVSGGGVGDPRLMLPEDTPPVLKKTNRGWIGFFVFIVVASIGVTVFMILFNRSIQLTEEQFQAAKKLWKENGPRDYRMVYTKRLNENTNVDTFIVTVRGRAVEEVLMNGKPLEPELRIYHSMDQLFNQINRFMEIDKKPKQPKVFVTAIFDEQTGALRRYIRRVMGTSQRVELHVTVEELGK